MDGVVVLDDDGCVRHVNSEASRILEISSEGLVGERLGALLGENHPISRLMRGVHDQHRATIQRDIVLTNRAQGRLEADVAVAPLGRTGAVVTLRDRTIANSLREEVSERQLLAAFGRIAAGIAHEVKNPLGGIRGAGELLEGKAEAPADREMAGLIVREVDRISSLVDELMVFARGERLRTTTINLHQVLDAVLELLALDPLCAGIEIERMYDPSIPEFLADPDRLKQVFLNLARNALQAMNSEDCGEKKLSISTRMALGRHLPDEDGRPIPALEVGVRDTGPGIEPDLLERLATPFYTTRVDGHGLGLAVSRHWVMLHGGSLKIESRVAEGTCARVLLPLKREVAQPERATPSTAESQRDSEDVA